METIKIEGIITVISPLHHGGDEKSGSESMLRRIKYIVDGKCLEIPYIEGNAVRGYLRRLLINDLLHHAGYAIKHPRLYHMLFAGGVLEEVSMQETSQLDLELRKKIRANLIPVALLGGSIFNQAFAGKVSVGKALPICKELNEYLPHKSQQSIFTFLDFSFNTRRDEREAPESKKKKKEKEQAVQMLYRYEVFVPGTQLYHWFTLMDANELEKACFARMLELWKERPFLGGRAAIGSGEIKFDYPGVNWPSSPYMNFLEENRDNIIKTLSELDT